MKMAKKSNTPLCNSDTGTEERAAALTLDNTTKDSNPY
jgi:hypothetical protein